MEYALKAKHRRLWRKIVDRRFGLYYDSMTESERGIVHVLESLGMVEKTFGSWTGELIYTSSPQWMQASGHSS